MVVFVIGSALLGLIAAAVAMAAGVSLLLAFFIYMGVGVSVIALVLVRATICLNREETKELLSPLA